MELTLGKGCAFNHDSKKTQGAQPQPERYTYSFGKKSMAEIFHSVKKKLNVDSPSFTPSSLSVSSSGQKSKGLSPKAASAAPFRPKSATPGRIHREHKG